MIEMIARLKWNDLHISIHSGIRNFVKMVQNFSFFVKMMKNMNSFCLYLSTYRFDFHWGFNWFWWFNFLHNIFDILKFGIILILPHLGQFISQVLIAFALADFGGAFDEREVVLVERDMLEVSRGQHFCKGR